MEAPVTDLRVFRDSFVGTLRGGELCLNVLMAVLRPSFGIQSRHFSFQVELRDAECYGAVHAETISPLDAEYETASREPFWEGVSERRFLVFSKFFD